MTSPSQAHGVAQPLPASKNNAAGVGSGAMDLRGGALTTFVYGIFATTWLGARWGVESFPPFTLGLIRLIIAGLVLLAFCRWRGYAFPRRRSEVLLAVGLGFFTAAVPSLAGIWGVQRTQVSLASVILATQPFVVALLAQRLLPAERLTSRRAVGLLVGFLGVGLVSLDKTGGSDAGSLWGQLALCSSTLSVAISTVLGKSLSSRWQPLPFTAVQTLGGAVFVLPAVLLFELGAPVQPSAQGVAAALYLALVPTALGYSLWMYLIGRHSASGVSSFAFAQPAFGIVLGALLLGEGFSALTVAGMVLVTWSILTVNRAG